MVTHAAESLDVQTAPSAAFGWFRRKASLVAAAAVVLLSSAVAVGASALIYQRFADVERPIARQPDRPIAAAQPVVQVPAANVVRGVPPAVDRELPADAAFTILVGSFPIGVETTPGDVSATTDWLEASGFRVFYAQVDLGSRGRWQRVLAGAYTDSQAARRDAERLKAAAPQSDVHLVSAGFAIGLVAAAPREPDTEIRPSGTEP
jgi:hypothetical protein